MVGCAGVARRREESAVNAIGRAFLRRVGWVLAGVLIFGAAQLLGVELPR